MSRIAIVVLAVGAFAAVAPAQPAQSPAQSSSPPSLPAVTTRGSTANTVMVQNDRKVPVTVYLEYGPFDRRLGLVAPYDVEALPLPGWAVSGHTTIRMFVHPEGTAGDLGSQEFVVRPPGRLALVVPLGDEPPAAPAPADTMSAVIPPDELADATVTVENPRARAVTVFAEQGDFDARLGTVPAGGEATLRFPRSVVGPDASLVLFVHPDGGSDLSSTTLLVRPGAHLGLRVPPR